MTQLKIFAQTMLSRLSLLATSGRPGDTRLVSEHHQLLLMHLLLFMHLLMTAQHATNRSTQQ